jgi:hypothetical protein
VTDPKITPTPATLRLVERVAAHNPGAHVAIMANALTVFALNFRDEPARQLVKSLATYQDTGDLRYWDEAIEIVDRFYAAFLDGLP